MDACTCTSYYTGSFIQQKKNLLDANLHVN